MTSLSALHEALGERDALEPKPDRVVIDGALYHEITLAHGQPLVIRGVRIEPSYSYPPENELPW